MPRTRRIQPPRRDGRESTNIRADVIEFPRSNVEIGVGPEESAVTPTLETFEGCFDEMFVRARRLAHRMLADPGAAEDVAAEAMVRTYAKWNRVQALPHRDAWVLRVTTNLALDVLRRRQPRQAPPLNDEFEDATAQRMTLAVALRQLPRRQREVIALRYLAGLSESDVAAALGIRDGTVKTHVSRALQRLRETLTDNLEETAGVFAN